MNFSYKKNMNNTKNLKKIKKAEEEEEEENPRKRDSKVPENRIQCQDCPVEKITSYNSPRARD